MASRRFSQFSSFLLTTGRSVQEIRAPTSWVTGWFGVADMWHEAQVGAAE